MKERRHAKRIRNLASICLLIAIILSASTYAWFIGMKTVKITSFDIDIATTEGLFLSMDGINWSYTLDARHTASYEGNTNVWADTEQNAGLIPMSTVGDMDSTSSTMKLFEKGSLTTTKGGFRLLTSRVNNNTADGNSKYQEGKGYVAFDLFVKNLSGTAYYTDNKEENEEAIYLTTNSEVKVASAGDGGVSNTGIENSVRVAFTQIGRVKGDNIDPTTIAGITCSDTTKKVGEEDVPVVTGICRNAQIWEPNDKDHVTNAINWYDTSCRTRKASGAHTYDTSSYNLAIKCKSVNDVVQGTSYPTYAVSRELGVDDNVDVYDGTKYNTYIANTDTYANYIAGLAAGAASDVENHTTTALEAARLNYKLIEYKYFTDSDKIQTGTDRPTFMTLAPNSITKLRVYVFIEGQDIDNYDFASLGRKISINFGFTKERFTESDIAPYNGPSTNITPAGTATY